MSDHIDLNDRQMLRERLVHLLVEHPQVMYDTAKIIAEAKLLEDYVLYGTPAAVDRSLTGFQQFSGPQAPSPNIDVVHRFDAEGRMLPDWYPNPPVPVPPQASAPLPDPFNDVNTGSGQTTVLRTLSITVDDLIPGPWVGHPEEATIDDVDVGTSYFTEVLLKLPDGRSKILQSDVADDVGRFLPPPPEPPAQEEV